MASTFVKVVDDGYAKLPAEEAFPLVKESTPLLQREGLSCARSVLSRGFGLGVLVTTVVLLCTPLVNVRHGGHGGHHQGGDRRKYCVAHAAYGMYVPVAEISRKSKEAYAAKNGYRFVELLGHKKEDFVATHCPELVSQMVNDYSWTTPVKVCGMWAVLRDSCDYVLWTDADAVIVDAEVSIERLMGLEKSPYSRELRRDAGAVLPAVYPEETQDILLFLNRECPGYNHTMAPGDCGRPRDFANCVNTGSLVLKSGAFAETFLRQQLTMAIFNNDFLTQSPCSTVDFDSGIEDWDQCNFPHKTEQCTLECLYRVQPTYFNSTICKKATAAEDYLTGVLLEDRFQQQVYGGNTTGNTTKLMDRFKESELMPSYDGSLVFNCMGGKRDAKLTCVRQATMHYWPEVADAVAAL